MRRETKQDEQSGQNGSTSEEEYLEQIKGRIEEIGEYLKAASKTEKDAAGLEARLNLTGEERNLTAEERSYRANLKKDRKQALEGFEEVKRDLTVIKRALDSMTEEGEHVAKLKECQKRTSKYLNEVEERMRVVYEEEKI